MQPLFDLHTHTIASGHAYSTLRENIEEAARAGLKALGTSEHAERMPGTAHRMYFMNFKVIPKELNGVLIFNGIEANIYGEKGEIDVHPSILEHLDYIIASLHRPCIDDLGEAGNTRAVLGAIENSEVTIIGHPDDSRYPIKMDEIVAAAAEYHTALEVNNSSMHPQNYRENARENILEMLECAKKYKANIILGTDSHICYEVGKFERALDVLEEAKFPEDLVINFDMARLPLVLRKERQRGKD